MCIRDSNGSSPFANQFFGGVINNYFEHGATTFQGVSNDPITDGLNLAASSSISCSLTKNENLPGSSVILTHPATGNTVGIKNETMNYCTVWISPNFSIISNNSQRDTLVSRILQWFEGTTPVQPQPPVLTDIPDVNMFEDSIMYIPLTDWYEYVSDEDTPDQELLWEVLSGVHVTATVEGDTLLLQPAENYYGPDTLVVIVSDDNLSDTGIVKVNVSGINDPPMAFNLLSPEDGYISDDTTNLLFSWEASLDIESRSVNYTIRFQAENFDTFMNVGSSPEIQIDLSSANFPEEIDISWMVAAYDGEDSTMASNAPFTFRINPAVGVYSAGELVPDNYVLFPNYPNPFNPTTHLSFSLPKSGNVSMIVYDIQGREVARLVDGWRNAGSHDVTFDGDGLASGIYLVRITAGQFSQTRKMVLLK